MKLYQLNTWLFTPFFSHNLNNIIVIENMFKKYVDLIHNFGFEFIDLEKTRKHFIIFIAMYSINKYSIKKSNPFYNEKNIKLFDYFSTMYSEFLIDFISDQQEYCNRHGIDILQKRNNSLFLEFIVFTCKQINIEILLEDIIV